MHESCRYPFLGNEFTISYAPSATIYALLSDRPKPVNEGTPLVFGNPASDNEGLGSLPFAEAEARAVAAELGVGAVLNQAATEGLLRERITEANVVHVTGHGIFDIDNPLSSYLALAPGSENDGRLEVREIYSLSLRQQSPLVVLSACQTASGKLTEGDEFQGLARAFLLKGAHTVVASLWAVDDEATSTLMVDFYRNRAAGMSDTQALSEAQRSVRENVDRPEWAEPYYWAAFVLVGR